MEMTLTNYGMQELNPEMLFDIDGGTFWGVVNGVFTCIAGGAGVVGGIALLAAPEPTGVTKVAGVAAIVVGGATFIGGIATIANNI